MYVNEITGFSVPKLPDIVALNLELQYQLTFKRRLLYNQNKIRPMMLSF